MSLYPKPLPDKGMIAVIAPSSRGDMAAMDGDIEILKQHGYGVAVHAQAYAAHHQSAGTAMVRAQAVMDVFCDPAIDAVLCARGGNRVMHALPCLDFDVIAAHPKPLIGFSDATALLNGIYAKTGLVTYHGPTLSRVHRATDGQLEQMLACLQGRGQRLDFSGCTALRGGVARGRMIGGNLSVFSALAGTAYMPDATGAIVFLEDIGDQLSRYDRMLMQLRLAGVFDKAAAVIFGVMAHEGDSSVTPFGFDVREIIAEHTGHLSVPVVMDAPFGHSGPLWTMPVGGFAKLDADAGTLTLEDTPQQ